MPTSASDILAGTKILLVEDEYYLADDMRIILQTAGATVIGPVATMEKACAEAQETSFDCAVLDINLHGKRSFELAYALVKRAVPLIFVSGYDGTIVPEDLRHVPRMTKPIAARAFLRCVTKMAGRPLVESEPVT